MGLRKAGSLQKENGVPGLHGRPAVKTQLPLFSVIFLGDLGIVLSVLRANSHSRVCFLFTSPPCVLQGAGENQRRLLWPLPFLGPGGAGDTGGKSILQLVCVMIKECVRDIPSSLMMASEV